MRKSNIELFSDFEMVAKRTFYSQQHDVCIRELKSGRYIGWRGPYSGWRKNYPSPPVDTAESALLWVEAND